MSLAKLAAYREIWAIDFEYGSKDGELVEPRCLCAKELNSGREIRLWLEVGMKSPFEPGDDILFVAYYALAELSCFRALGWEISKNWIDLYAEFRCHTNKSETEGAKSLVAALKYFGLEEIDESFKEHMRLLALRGGEYSDLEKSDLIAYCFGDCLALERLLIKICPLISFEDAKFRGLYLVALSHAEYGGTPIDLRMLNRLRQYWPRIQDLLITEIDGSFDVFEGRVFKRDKFKSYLQREGLSWPLLSSGEIQLTEDVFREMSEIHPCISPLRDLRVALSRMRLIDISVGQDGKNRCMLSPFKSKTGRNQPSTTRFIFSPSSWVRGLITPAKGNALAYVDWSQQEFGIAAALSGDQRMLKAYESGDPYLEFAKQVGAVPDNATKQSHSPERDLFKACVLAVQYGMGDEALASRIQKSIPHASELLSLHRQNYAVFWAWSDRVVDHANLTGYVQTVFGWRMQVSSSANSRSVRNFPMQANGAEMLRVAVALLYEAGIKVCAPVHDAVLIEVDEVSCEAEVSKAQDVMQQASEIVLGGFKLRSDAKIIRFGERYIDPRGEFMWTKILQILERLESHE
jgi:DNA polymerase-1